MTVSRTREDSGWRPEWDDTFRGWAINFIRENRWRCEGIYDPDDLLQDAYLTFRRVRAAYPRVTEPRHFMALFKVAMRNEMFDKARYKKYKSEVEVVVDAEQQDYLTERIEGEAANAGYLAVMLSEMPEEVKLILRAFSDEKLLGALREEYKRNPVAEALGLPKFRETLNMKLARILKLPKGMDFVGVLREALSK